MFKFERPIVFFDLETTGVEVAKDRIVQIAMQKVSWNVESVDGLFVGKPVMFMINPGIPIPKEASDIHGISDEMVADKPLFESIGISILEYLQGCDLAGFNIIRFDIPLLVEEFLRVGLKIDLSHTKFFDSQVIFHRKEERTLAAAYKFYLGRELEGAHNATVDVTASAYVFFEQLERYKDLPLDREGMHMYSMKDKKIVDFAGKFAYNDKGEIVFTFGNQWMVDKDFTEDTKRWCKRILNPDFDPVKANPVL